jgi:hypothetical protein
VRIGVTGHRCIADPEAVEAAVASRLQEIRELFAVRRGLRSANPLQAIRKLFVPRPHAPVVFSVLSALAEGADRIVARIALDAESGLGAELGAVLPLAPDDYLEDFETDESKREFSHLLSLAAARTDLHRGPAPRGQARDAAYNRAGRYIVDRSDLLIAVWDGRVAQGHGGTAEVVEYARHKKVPVMVIPARSCEGEEVAVSEVFDSSQAPSVSRAASDAFARIAHYNAASDRASRERQGVESELVRLGRPLEGTSMHWRYKLVADWALPRIARADRLAIANHRRHTTITWAVQLLAALAVTVVAVQTLFFARKPIVLTGEIFLVLVLLLAVAVGRRARFHVRWIGYRSMAEAFRSGLFLALSGGEEHPPRALSAGVLGEPGEAWFQRAFSQAWRSCPEIALERSDAVALRNFLVEGWLDDQIDYHRRTASRCRRLQDVYTWIVGVLALATVTVAVLHIAEVGGAAWTGGALRLSALMLPAFGGAVVGLREYGQLRLHEERSKRAVNRLQAVRDRLFASGTLASVRRLAVEAQRVMLGETVDWYGVVEFQDVDIII